MKSLLIFTKYPKIQFIINFQNIINFLSFFIFNYPLNLLYFILIKIYLHSDILIFLLKFSYPLHINIHGRVGETPKKYIDI